MRLFLVRAAKAKVRCFFVVLLKEKRGDQSLHVRVHLNCCCCCCFGVPVYVHTHTHTFERVLSYSSSRCAPEYTRGSDDYFSFSTLRKAARNVVITETGKSSIYFK